eukprot:5255457-Alexandrium_andersonii.AAC.1
MQCNTKGSANARESKASARCPLQFHAPVHVVFADAPTTAPPAPTHTARASQQCGLCNCKGG